MNKKRVRLAILIIVGIAVITGVYSYRKRFSSESAARFAVVATIAGGRSGLNGASFEDPFGIAVGPDGAVYVSDGEKGSVWLIKSDGSASIIVQNLDTPSGLAVVNDGSIVVAETGAQVIRRVYPSDGRSEIIAGTIGQAGFVDGIGSEALFNGPVGVAVDDSGTVFVADTYNDRIRAIDKDGRTRTVAGGGEAGFADALVGTDARFNTPCGIAVGPRGTLIIADTGNHRIRAIDPNGSVRTIAGTGKRGSGDQMLFAATFDEPVGVAVDTDGTIYVVDSRASALRGCGWNLFPRVWTLIGKSDDGFQDGDISTARISHPAGIALAPNGSIVFTDNANKVVRGIGDGERLPGARIGSNDLPVLTPNASAIRSAAPPRWPFDPPDRPREIAATFGEIRGELTDSDKEAWFHNGLDIPGGYGEIVHAIRSERVLNPLSVADVGTTRERIRFPLLGYIHLRIGRDASDRVLDQKKFVIQRDADGGVTLVRVRRGTRFEAGEAIGTLNNQNHVHLTAGPLGNEVNAIAALDFPGIKDTVAPTIEPNGVRLFDSGWHELRAAEKDMRINIMGDIRIVVRAFDQMDGNAARRRLGIYRLGYQLFAEDGTSAPGFAGPKITISFESLPRDDTSAWIAYATGSQSGATGETIFAYVVTNFVRDKEAQEGVFSTSAFKPGNYTIQVFVEDFFGNRSTRDLLVRIGPTIS